MSILSLCLSLATLPARAAKRTSKQDPPPELLKNLEFFMEYELVKNLDLLDSPVAKLEVQSSTPTARVPATSVQRSTSTARGKR